MLKLNADLWDVPPRTGGAKADEFSFDTVDLGLARVVK
jgi:hypothetical protein